MSTFFPGRPGNPGDASHPNFAQLKQHIHSLLIRQLDIHSEQDLATERARLTIHQTIERLCDSESPLMNRMERERLITEILDEVVGFGALQPLISDPSIREILIIDENRIHIRRTNDRLEVATPNLDGRDHLMRLLDRMSSRAAGKALVELMPVVNLVFSDGMRVDAIVPPTALDVCPMVVIRLPRGTGESDEVEIGVLSSGGEARSNSGRMAVRPVAPPPSGMIRSVPVPAAPQSGGTSSFARMPGGTLPAGSGTGTFPRPGSGSGVFPRGTGGSSGSYARPTEVSPDEPLEELAESTVPADPRQEMLLKLQQQIRNRLVEILARAGVYDLTEVEREALPTLVRSATEQVCTAERVTLAPGEKEGLISSILQSIQAG